MWYFFQQLLFGRRRLYPTGGVRYRTPAGDVDE